MTALYYIVLGCFGLAVGSFLNVCVWRTREDLSFVYGRSMCPTCKKNIAWYDNIPLLSFTLLRGRCRGCQTRISAQYPLVELILGLSFLFVAWHHMTSGVAFVPAFVRDLSLIIFLGFIFLYDLQYKEIHTGPTIYPAVVLFLASLFFSWRSWSEMVIGVAVAAGFFLLQFVVSKGKWIGGGDVRFGVLMGVILGWPLTVVGLFFSYVGGALLSIPQLLFKKKKMKSEIPFGTYLVLGTVAAMFFGERVLNWYLQLL